MRAAVGLMPQRIIASSVPVWVLRITGAGKFGNLVPREADVPTLVCSR